MQGGVTQTEHSKLTELRQMLEFRLSRSLESVRFSAGRRELLRDRDPEMCIRVPLRLIERGLQMYRLKLHKAR